MDGRAGEWKIVMRQRYLVGMKLIETFCRGMFLLVSTYLLPLEDAGHFGLVATIVGLLAFVLGYERYIDLQRQIAGRSPAAIRRRLAQTVRFFAVQYTVILPLVVAVLVGRLHWSILEVATLLIIIVTEHVSNQSYHAVLLDRRAYPLMVAAAAKNFVQMLSVSVMALQSAQLTAHSVLTMWAVVSISYLVIATLLWLYWMRLKLPRAEDELSPQSPRQQYQASALHFLVGLVAVAALQVDRLVVGGTLTPAEIGIYFRNISLAALALQIFNIASFNRVAPEVYRRARDGQLWSNFRTVRDEYLRFSVLLVGLVSVLLVVNHFLGSPARTLGIQASFWLLLSIAVLMRTAADYIGLLLLSVGGDKVLFRNQLTAVLFGASCLWGLSVLFKLSGAFVGVMVTPMIYFVLNSMSLRRQFNQP